MSRGALLPRALRPGPMDRVVPRAGFTASLTIGSAAAMAFLAVFALALVASADRVAHAWETALERTATVRIAGAAGTRDRQEDAVLRILSQTPGIESFRTIDESEQIALLEPWLDRDLPLDKLRLPVLIEVTEGRDGPDAEGLRQRLAAEAPDAVYDTHSAWADPVVAAAGRLRAVGWLAVAVVAAAASASIALAASAALAANGQIIEVLRLVGAEDAFVARAFVRRFTLHAATGASFGTIAGAIAVAVLPGDTAGAMGQVGFEKAQWLLVVAVPPAAAALALAATRLAAARRLREVS